MKKVLVFTILCMVLLLLVPGVVSAEDTTNENDGLKDTSSIDPKSVKQSGTTTVTYGLGSLYYLVVPQDFTISADVTRHPLVRVSDARLPKDMFVNVTISSENYDNNVNGEGEASWRMMFSGLKNSDNFIRYHVHTVDRVDSGNKDSLGNPIYNYENSRKVQSGSVFMSAPADAFKNGDGEVDQYLEIHVGENTKNAASYAGQYWDTLVFSAGIFDANNNAYSPESGTGNGGQ